MKNIVHVIDNLGRGGAETLFTDLLPALSKHYNIILVTLNDLNEFDQTVFGYCYKHYCLHHTSRLALARTVKRLKRIIAENEPVLVRSQLFWSSVIAKLACPKRIPLVFSVHITMEVFQETVLGPFLALIEKATLSHRQTMLGVTRQVVESYQKKFGFNGKAHVLYNYVRKEFFTERRPPVRNGLRLLAVGNLRPQKNYQYLIDAFRLLKGKNVSLDIYGSGPLHQTLAEQINQYGLHVYLKGKSADIPQLMREYDAFVMASSFEGFGIAAAEAMAAGLPLILSDIPVLREVTENGAFFVNLKSPQSFAHLVEAFLTATENIYRHVVANRKVAEEKYTQEVYLRRLLAIYNEAILAA